MMKKIALLLLVMLLSLNMVFASGSTEASADAGTEGTKIVLFQHKTEIYDQLEAMAEAYEAETGVEVEVWRISGNDYYTNLTTYMSSGAGPTVFTLRSDAEINEMSPYLADLGDLDVTSRINSELRGVVDGKTIGIPMTAEGFGFIYNKELVSTDDLASMDSLISFMEECAENGITGVGLSQESRFLIGQILNFPFALQPDPIDFCQRLYAGEIELADVPEFQDFARLFEAIRSIQKNPLEVSYDNNCGDFATGATAMIHQGNWAYSVIADFAPEFDMAMTGVPLCGNDKIAAAVSAVWCVNVDASEAEQQAAKDFLDWLYTSENGTHFLFDEFGFIPVVDGIEAPDMDPLSASVAEAVSSGNTIPWTYNTEWPTGFITAYLVSIAEEFFVSDMTGTEFLDILTDAFVTAANE